MSLIYELDIKESDEIGRIDASELSEYQLFVLQKYLENKVEIDAKIAGSLKGWNMSSIAKIELALLRLCLTEIFFVEEVPNKVAINETIEISKVYADDKASKFLNGVIRKCIDDLEI